MAVNKWTVEQVARKVFNHEKQFILDVRSRMPLKIGK